MGQTNQQLSKDLENVEMMFAEKWWRSASKHFQDLHFEVRILGKNMFLIWGNVANVMTLAPFFFCWKHFIKYKKSQMLFEHIIWGNLKIANIENIRNCVFYDSENLEFGNLKS